MFVTQNSLFVNHTTQKTILRHLSRRSCTRLENMILGQLKIGERQAFCGGLSVIALKEVIMHCDRTIKMARAQKYLSLESCLL